MDLSKTLVLGFIAGVTIVIGLPIGRLRRPMPLLKHFLNAVAIGILLFLVWDVLSHAWEPIDTALAAVHDHSGGLGPAFGYGALGAYDRYLDRAGRNTGRGGPGAMSVSETPARLSGLSTWSAARPG